MIVNPALATIYVVGHVPQTISVPCGLFLKKGGTISCVVTGPRQPRYSRDPKSYSVISSVSANLHVLFPHKVYVPIHTGPRKYSVPSLIVLRAESP